MKYITIIFITLNLIACGQAPTARELQGEEKILNQCEIEGGKYINLQSPDKCGMMGAGCIKKTEDGYTINNKKVVLDECKLAQIEYYYNSI